MLLYTQFTEYSITSLCLSQFVCTHTLYRNQERENFRTFYKLAYCGGIDLKSLFFLLMRLSASSLFESIVLVGLFIYFSIDRLFFMSIAFILTFIYGMSSYRSLQRDRFTGVYSDQK